MKVIDLFSGCGGLSMGFENAGFEILMALDNMPVAVEIYKKNFDHDCQEHDLSDVPKTVEMLKGLDYDGVIGGPPCQDFSSAGPRDPMGKRANLTYSFMDTIIELQPKFFVMENVPTIKGTEILDDICERFQEVGYGLTAVILNAALCGVPQRRKRFFLIGELQSANNKFIESLSQNLAIKEMTVKDYFGDKIEFEFYYRHPRSYARRGVYTVDEPSATIRGVNRPIPPNYKKHSADKADPSKQNVHVLSSMERAQIQTFPDDFILSNIKSKDQVLIGNAVPVKLGEFVAKALKSGLKSGFPKSEQPLLMPQSYLKYRAQKKLNFY